MNRRLLRPLVIIILAPVLLSRVRAVEGEDRASGICPLWPIQQIGNQYLYYAEYHLSLGSCSTPQAAYLQGTYSWPATCSMSPHLCVGTGYKKGSPPYGGKGVRVPHDYDPKQEDLPSGQAGDLATFDAKTRKVVVFKDPVVGTDRYAVIFQVVVPTADKSENATLYYGFETTNPNNNPDELKDAKFIGTDGQDMASGTSHVVRGTHNGQSYVVFLE